MNDDDDDEKPSPTCIFKGNKTLNFCSLYKRAISSSLNRYVESTILFQTHFVLQIKYEAKMKYQLPGLVGILIFCVKVLASFIFVNLCLITFFIPLVVLLPFRRILSLIFSVVYKGKYKLVDSPDAVYAAWSSFRNTSNIIYFLYVDGSCDITKVRERIKENILRRDQNGIRPFSKLLKSFEEKFKFLCLTDCSTTIDFNHHVRVCPGMDDVSKVYKEHEFLDVVAKLVDEEWPECKPKWEILVVPRVKCEESGKISSILIFKVQHFYMDGISVHRFIQNCIADQPTPPLLFDPTNPPITPVARFYKLETTLQNLILEPYLTLRNFWSVTNRFPCEKAIGGKIYGRTNTKISQQTIRNIRSYHKCSTEAVFHSAFLGSLHKMAKSKGLPIPSQTIAAKVCANLPYPSESPINLAFFGHQLIKTEFKDPIERLHEMNDLIASINHRHSVLKYSLILTRILCWYPMTVARFFVKFFKPSYYLSNVPGLPENLKLHGSNIEFIYAYAPLTNGVGYCGVVDYYRGGFSTGLLANESALIENREDMDKWISEYENEIRFLEEVSDAKQWGLTD